MENNNQGITMNGVPVAKASELPVGTVAAASVEPVLYDEETSKEKQGGKCCGCCCDYRRAVIIINGLLIVASVVEMLTALLVKPENNIQFNSVDDDAVLEELETMSSPLAIIAGLGLLFHPIALFGAIKYNVRLVALGICWTIGAMAAEMSIQFNTWSAADDLTKDGESLGSPLPGLIGSIIGTGLFVYAHFMLIREIKSGTISRATYEREKYSCCCVV